MAENLPSGKALMPGDIIRFYNGKTAEIKNTDAEGRLILADALAYTVKHYNPDAIIDLATLTGACSIALGPFFSALMSQHDALIEEIQEAAQLSGDRVWELPLDDDFKPSIKSSVADMANTTDRKYGAQTVCSAFFYNSLWVIHRGHIWILRVLHLMCLIYPIIVLAQRDLEFDFL